MYEIEVKFSEISNELTKLHTKQIKIESRLENTEGDLERINKETIDINDEIDLLEFGADEHRKNACTISC